MRVGGFHAVPGRCRGLQNLAGASKGLQAPPGTFGGPGTSRAPKPQNTQQKHLSNLGKAEISCGMVGLTRPPTMAGGGRRVCNLNALRLDASANLGFGV